MAFFILLKHYLISVGLLNKILNAPAWLATIIAALAGSLFAGNPTNSYVLAGYMYKEGLSLVAVTSFLIAWVTVGIVQAPVEKEYFGWRFTLLRNALSFLFALLAALIISTIYISVIK